MLHGFGHISTPALNKVGRQVVVERNRLTRGEGFRPVEADIGNPGGEFLRRAMKGRAGQDGDARLAQRGFTQRVTTRDTALRQPRGKRRKIRKEIKSPNRRLHPDAGRLQNLRAALAQGRQDTTDVREIALDRNAVLKRPDRRILNRALTEV